LLHQRCRLHRTGRRWRFCRRGLQSAGLQGQTLNVCGDGHKRGLSLWGPFGLVAPAMSVAQNGSAMAVLPPRTAVCRAAGTDPRRLRQWSQVGAVAVGAIWFRCTCDVGCMERVGDGGSAAADCSLSGCRDRPSTATAMVTGGGGRCGGHLVSLHLRRRLHGKGRRWRFCRRELQSVGLRGQTQSCSARKLLSSKRVGRVGGWEPRSGGGERAGSAPEVLTRAGSRGSTCTEAPMHVHTGGGCAFHGRSIKRSWRRKRIAPRIR
jgi:hypothetical protein